MASRVLRRSANVVIDYLKAIDYQPKMVCMVGVGLRHEDANAMTESWPGIEMIGFEPHPLIFHSIKNTFPGNVKELAISDKVKTSPLRYRVRGKNLASLCVPIKGKFETVSVCVSTLDFELMPANRKDVLLWLDCEGSELDALKGGEKFVDQCVSVVNIEMTNRPRGEGWASPKDIHQWLMLHEFHRVWSHTIRTCIGQYDAIYLKRHLLREDFRMW